MLSPLVIFSPLSYCNFPEKKERNAHSHLLGANKSASDFDKLIFNQLYYIYKLQLLLFTVMNHISHPFRSIISVPKYKCNKSISKCYRSNYMSIKKGSQMHYYKCHSNILNQSQPLSLLHPMKTTTSLRALDCDWSKIFEWANHDIPCLCSHILPGSLLF